MKFQALYKLTVNNKIQQWIIATQGNKIITIQGQLNGKQQKYEDIITSGKNIGRSNETTPEQQAELEARSRWNKKYNKDYHIVIKACYTNVKTARAGGYLPMLAHEYEDHATKYLKYPCYVQPKLNGIRCISKEDKKVSLWFRSGKQIITMQHIINDLKKVIGSNDIWDGELYAHNEDFSKFTGAIRADKNLNPEVTKQIKYHIYDWPRIDKLTESHPYINRLKKFNILTLPNNIIKVDTFIVYNFKEAMTYYKQFIKQGYEGMIFRNIDMVYEQKRSYSLLKYKEWIDDEFEIIGIKEGRGSLKGHVGSFICKIEAGRILKDINNKKFTHVVETTFDAKLKGKHSRLKYLFEHPEECIGEQLTVEYHNLLYTGKPCFGVGKEIRFDK